MDVKTAERVLGLSGTYDDKEAAAAYRKMLAKHHPDAAALNGADPDEASKKTQEIHEAYKVVGAALSKGPDVYASQVPVMRQGGFFVSTPASYVSTSNYKTSRPQQKQPVYRGFGYRGDTRHGQGYAERRAQYYQTYPHEPSTWDLYVDEPMAEPRIPEWLYIPREDVRFSSFPTTDPRASSMPAPKSSGKQGNGEKADAKGDATVLEKVVRHFPYRIAFLALAAGLFFAVTGLSPLQLTSYSPVGSGEDRILVCFGSVFLMAFVNLLFGWLTDDFRASMIWLVSEIEGKAKLETIRYRIFGHIPYRLLFLVGASIWYLNAPPDTRLALPISVVVFGLSVFNFCWPVMTDFLAGILAGHPHYDE